MSDIAFPLAGLFRASSEAAQQPDKRGLPEVQVARLRDAFDRSTRPRTFKPGDLVTPRRDATVRGAGDPHVVLETIGPIMPSFRSDACCGEKRIDMRVAYVDQRGHIETHWAESWEWEGWSQPSAATAAPAAVDQATAAPAEASAASPWAPPTEPA